MSSFNIRNIREIPNDPFAKFGVRLSKELSKFLNKQQTDKLENKEDIYVNGQDVDTVIKFHSDLSSTKYFDLLTPYYSTKEPDYDKCKLWLKGNNLGNTLNDISGFDNHATIEGDPMLTNGTPFDYGIHTGGTKSIALQFNRPTSDLVNQEYLNVPDSTTLQIAGLATGMSYFIRFRIKSLAQQGGQSRTLFKKVDDLTPNDAIVVKVESNGKLIIEIKDSGTEVKKETATSTILIDTVYELFIVYTVSGNAIAAYLNGVLLTLSNSSDTPNYGTADKDLHIMKRDTAGFVYGDLYDFEVWREKILSFSSVGSSIVYDGTGDYVDMGTQSTLWAQSKSKWSVSFWIKLNSTANQTVGGSTAWGVTNGSVLFWIFGGNQIGIGIWNAGLEVDAWRTGTLDTTTWHHFVGTYDSTLGSANLKFYYDGVVGGTTGNATTTNNPNDAMRLGWTGAGALNGNTRDFKYWPNRVLTQTEITNIKNDSVLAPRPDYWLRMTEGSGTPTDMITTTLTASLNGNAAWVTNDIGNHYINKWSTSYIPFGRVMVSNYWASYIDTILGLPVSSSSFTTASFTGTSFTV